LRRLSTWQVFLAIAATTARYGGIAKLGIEDLARLTELSPRTVKTAVAELLAAGLIVRLSRYRNIIVPILASPQSSPRLGFTARQERVVERALRQASMLTLANASNVVMSNEEALRVGLESGVTYGIAFDRLRAADPVRCREFVGIVLAMRYGERVAGRLL
jgi:DNA-binding GntR family transcriptional regulator